MRFSGCGVMDCKMVRLGVPKVFLPVMSNEFLLPVVTVVVVVIVTLANFIFVWHYVLKEPVVQIVSSISTNQERLFQYEGAGDKTWRIFPHKAHKLMLYEQVD